MNEDSVTMVLFWFTLIFLHQGHSLVPVVTVELGQPVTLTCTFSMKYQSKQWLYWFKQRAGDTLSLIMMQMASISPKYGPELSASKYIVTSTENSNSLTILTTVEQDEGMYHCAQMFAQESTWSGNYLLIKNKGNSEKTSNYTLMNSNAVHTSDSKLLQCSVLSDLENTTCSEKPNVFWFRAGSDKSLPDTIYTGGQGAGHCNRRSDYQKRCFYNFSKNINSTDPSTYYCALATCGQILFINEINHKNGETNKNQMMVITRVTMICLVISVIGNFLFICFRIRRSACQRSKEIPCSQGRSDFSQIKNNTEDGLDLNYAALRFSEERKSQVKKKRDMTAEESVYSQVKGSL